MNRVSNVSTRPPAQPASAPMGTPMSTMMTWAPRPTSIDTRAP
jgi:hypothetical protein